MYMLAFTPVLNSLQNIPHFVLLVTEQPSAVTVKIITKHKKSKIGILDSIKENEE